MKLTKKLFRDVDAFCFNKIKDKLKPFLRTKRKKMVQVLFKRFSRRWDTGTVFGNVDVFSFHYS